MRQHQSLEALLRVLHVLGIDPGPDRRPPHTLGVSSLEVGKLDVPRAALEGKDVFGCHNPGQWQGRGRGRGRGRGGGKRRLGLGLQLRPGP